MVSGMATRKVTITLDEQQLEEIRALVASGTSKSISGFVQHAVRTSLDDVREWDRTLEEMLAETGGPMTDAEREWADEVLSSGQKREKRKPRRRTSAA